MTRRTRGAVLLPAVMLLVMISAAWRHEPRPPGAPRTHALAIKGFAYLPAKITVSLGDTIVWTNEDFTVHTVTADTLRWDSGDLAAKKQYRVTATKRGALGYHCELHPTMKGTIVIE
jgi:plastocyanin